MSLPRLIFATTTVKAFIELPKRHQAILTELLSHRNMHNKPLCPTSYLSYQVIADATQLKAVTVRRELRELIKADWITEVSYRHNDGVREFQFDIHKVREELSASFDIVDNAEENANIEGVFEHDGKFWRQGGFLEFQSRLSTSRLWADNPNPPPEVVEHFA